MAASESMAGGATNMIWLTLAVVGALWAACWALAGLATMRNFDVAAVLLRAVDARARRRRVRNIVIGAPLLATVFSLVAVALIVGPALSSFDSSGALGVGLFLHSRRTVHAEYLMFCAAAACVSMACGTAYLEIASSAGAAAPAAAAREKANGAVADFSRKHVQGALGASAAAWAICGAAASAVLVFVR